MKIDSSHDFGTRECPSCGVRVPANENRCPICHYPFPVKSTLSRSAPLIALVLLLIFLALLLPLLL
ncbi:MAG: hypothetical protein ILO10_04070 [Kiritimatiellae bacterium]|nr:hypothetical protein [Kiritimatiellia bacterium]